MYSILRVTSIGKHGICVWELNKHYNHILNHDFPNVTSRNKIR